MTVEKLARLLMGYEVDGPHTGLYASDRYFSFSEAQLQEFLAGAHRGDCTKEPMTCMRCVAEDATHKARWILEHA